MLVVVLAVVVVVVVVVVSEWWRLSEVEPLLAESDPADSESVRQPECSQ